VAKREGPVAKGGGGGGGGVGGYALSIGAVPGKGRRGGDIWGIRMFLTSGPEELRE